ncbi:dihydrofolate reductase family protein [Niabella sp. CJ426]|uniref:dihydrofolate reductase family protein n=1 Tax=Niabella sp. CJ426 TaxID=3393740 RepID=UPI003D0174A9
MRKIIWIAHTSLDGYVANKAGKLDDFESGEDNLDFVGEVCREAGTILSGRITYELLHSFWPDAGKLPGATRAKKKYSDWYNGTTKIVVTRTPAELSKDNTCFVHDNLVQYIRQAKGQKGSSIVIFGSASVGGQLMEHNLIDVYWIFVNPVIFGSGVPLFKNGANRRKLRLIETRRFANGEAALKYVSEN